MPAPQVPDNIEAARALKSRASDVDAATRQLTPLENEMLDEMCRAVAQGHQDCCYAKDIADNRMFPIIKRYRPDVDLEMYER